MALKGPGGLSLTWNEGMRVQIGPDVEIICYKDRCGNQRINIVAAKHLQIDRFVDPEYIHFDDARKARVVERGAREGGPEARNDKRTAAGNGGTGA